MVTAILSGGETPASLGGKPTRPRAFSSAKWVFLVQEATRRASVLSGTLMLIAGILLVIPPASQGSDRCFTGSSAPNGDNIGYYSPAVTTTFGARGRIEFNDPNLCTDQNGSDGTVDGMGDASSSLSGLSK